MLHLYFFRSSCINNILHCLRVLICHCNDPALGRPILPMHVAEKSRLALSELTFSHQKMWLQAGDRMDLQVSQVTLHCYGCATSFSGANWSLIPRVSPLLPENRHCITSCSFAESSSNGNVKICHAVLFIYGRTERCDVLPMLGLCSLKLSLYLEIPEVWVKSVKISA